MGYSNRDNRGGDRNKSYGKRSYDAPRFDKPQMHSATCDNCGKTCEVPFKPTGARPVYCRECFSTMGGRNESRGNYERRNDSPRPQPQPQSQENKEQLDKINAKLDEILNLLNQNQNQSIIEEVTAENPTEIAEVEKKVSKKKALKK